MTYRIRRKASPISYLQDTLGGVWGAAGVRFKAMPCSPKKANGQNRIFVPLRPESNLTMNDR